MIKLTSGTICVSGAVFFSGSGAGGEGPPGGGTHPHLVKPPSRWQRFIAFLKRLLKW